MNYKKAEYFLKVCETKNISTAAAELYTSRTALSRILKELEDEFQVELFTRSKQGVALTNSGIIVKDMMHSFLSNYKYACEQLDKIREDRVTDIIRIGVTPTNCRSSYDKLLCSFMKKHPDIKIYIEEHSAFDIYRLLIENALDVGISPIVYDAESFNSIVLYTDYLVMGMRKDDPLASKSEISLSDIEDLPLGFLTTKAPMEGVITEYMHSRKKKPNIAIRTSDKALLHDMTLNGDVYCFLTEEILSHWSDIHYCNINFTTPSVVKLWWQDFSTERPAFRTFLEHMKSTAEKTTSEK